MPQKPKAQTSLRARRQTPSASAQRPRTDSERTVLFALVGMSPAVLTETVYALALQSPPVIPDEIHVVTTETGRQKLLRDVLGPDDATSPILRLRQLLAKRKLPVENRLRFGKDFIHVPTRQDRAGREIPLDDIASEEDNALLADLILKELRAHTENPDTRVVASLAGGRKSMSALLLSCMSLLARPQDSACHVLVSPPEFERPLAPPFFFPEPGVRHSPPKGKPIPSAKAAISLFDIPFVRTRKLYEDRHGRLPGTYSTLVRDAQGCVDAVCPKLAFDFAAGRLAVDGQDAPLSAAELVALYFCLCPDRIPAGVPAESDHPSPLDLLVYLKAHGDAPDGWPNQFIDSTRFEGDAVDSAGDYAKVLSALRLKLKAWPQITQSIPLRNRSGLPYPRNRISADIQTLFQKFRCALPSPPS